MARTPSTTSTAVPPALETNLETPVGLNLAVVWGPCSAGVEVRTLESGSRMASLSIRTPAAAPRGRGRNPDPAAPKPAATSVPITVWEPPAWVETLEAGDVVIVVGSVRRRFFATRAGGRGAKSEVEAVTIAKATPKALDQAWQRAAGVLELLA